jgi:hypothetical protein
MLVWMNWWHSVWYYGYMISPCRAGTRRSMITVKEAAIWPHPEPFESSTQPNSLQTDFNITLSSSLRSPIWSVSFRIAHKILYNFISMLATWSADAISLFCHRNGIWWPVVIEQLVMKSLLCLLIVGSNTHFSWLFCLQIHSTRAFPLCT